MRFLRAWPGLLLAVLSLVALLPWSPEGPFDARDYASLPGVHLEYPAWAALLEPVLAPAQILTGAPDFRLALLSFAIWTAVIAMMAGAVTGRGLVGRAGRAAAWTAASLGVLVLYTLVVALVHLPGWRLAVADPDLIVADLQSHTFGSHDGLATAEQNLRWHQARGYDLVAITEHKIPAGAYAAQEVAKKDPVLPGVIPGVEVRAYEGEFLLGLGLRRDLPVVLESFPPQAYASEFVRSIHEDHGGAVVALSWLLAPRHVEGLAAAGIDGIELVNTGHPDLPDAVREAMLGSADKGMALIASTDWHGWGGFTRTWTLVRVPGAATMDGAAKADAVVALLRARNTAAFTPVVAGYMGPYAGWRLALAPWAETVRYAAELSPGRVLSWWLWGMAAWLALRRLSARGWRPLHLAAGALVGGLGATLTYRAVELLGFREAGAAHEYALEMGRPALLVGATALVVALLLVWRERRRVVSARLTTTATRP